MCGFITWFGAGCKGRNLPSALASITHRGPDDQGVESDDWSWMGFRRLAILDLSAAGHQPMIFGDGRYRLVFNGEIYNYAELRTRYLQDVRLDSGGDTAVLGALLERMPLEKVLGELRGMFSFVWYDCLDRTVKAARDHFGIKPLYYLETADGGLGLASEMRALDYACGHSLSLDTTAVGDYFRWGAVQGPHSLLEGLRTLSPGHWLEKRERAPLTTGRWFTPEWRPDVSRKRSTSDWKEKTRSEVLHSVKAHLVSDVPVGVFLSSGLDSSIIACALKELGQRKFTAFSIGYEDGSGVEDESRQAQRSAKFFGAEFHAEVIGPDTLFNGFEKYIESLDQPTGDGFNTFLVVGLAAQHVKVALSGLGADEFFCGYTFHRMLHKASEWGLRSLPSRKFLLPFLQFLGSNPRLADRSAFLRKGAAFSRMMRHESLGAIYREWRGMMPEMDIATLTGMSQPAGGGLDSLPDVTDLQRLGGDEEAHRLLALESQCYLPNTLLRDNDCVSMAHSLELRTPFVDREIFALSSKMPSDQKLNGQVGKKILREAFADLLPPWVKEEKLKKTFTLPLMKWLRSPQWKGRIDDVLRSRGGFIRGQGGGAALDHILARFHEQNAYDKSAWHTSQRVWLCLVLEAWLARRRKLITGSGL